MGRAGLDVRVGGAQHLLGPAPLLWLQALGREGRQQAALTGQGQVLAGALGDEQELLDAAALRLGGAPLAQDDPGGGVVSRQEPEGPQGERVVVVPQGDELAVVLEDAAGYSHLGGGVDGAVVGGQGDPGLAGGEPGLLAAVPVDGGAGVVAGYGGDAGQDGGRVVAGAHALVEVVDGLQVPVVLDGAEDRVGHAQLLALVDVGGAAVGVEDRGEGLGRADAPGGVVVAEAGDGAGLVVVVPVGGVPALLRAHGTGGGRVGSEGGLPMGQVLLEGDELEGLGVELAAGPVGEADVLELEDHVELTSGGVGVESGLGARGPGHLSDGQDVAGPRCEDLLVHLVQELMDAGAVGDGGEGVAVEVTLALGRVSDRVGLGDEVDDVHAEAVDAAVQPPGHHLVDGAAHLRVLPVEVGLLG